MADTERMKQSDAPTVVIVLLAAGRATRMGDSAGHKLLAEFDGVPLVQQSARTAVDSSIGPVIVVTGHAAGDIEACLDALPLLCIRNPDYQSGLASSINTGLRAAVSLHADGILVMLADMPAIRPKHLVALHVAFTKAGGRSVVRATAAGRRGNPVILPKACFPAIRELTGDVGARHVINTAGLGIVDIDLGEAASLDVDTPEAVIAAGGTLRR